MSRPLGYMAIRHIKDQKILGSDKCKDENNIG